MAKRQVFFSFEYNKDNWRASQVRNMGKVDDSSTFSDNDWEEVKDKSETSIKAWIDSQLSMRSCLVVLIGSTTSSRKWVKYEIEKAYELKKGIVGIYIHNLKDKDGHQTVKGHNPFNQIATKDHDILSNYVNCFDSKYTTSQYVYNDISENIESLIENAINKSGEY
jgi:UDP-2,3-diacylglucosamine pyrophosphatase LpxH